MVHIMLAIVLFLSMSTLAFSQSAEQGAGSSNKSPSSIDRRQSYGVSPEYSGNLPTMSAINMRTATLRRIHVDLEEPWAFEFLSDTEILLTERKARLLRIDLDQPPR